VVAVVAGKNQKFGIIVSDHPKIDAEAIEAIKNLRGALETAEKLAFGGQADEMELLGAIICCKEALDFFCKKLGVPFDDEE